MTAPRSHPPVTPEVKAAIEQILRKNLTRYGFVRATVEPGEDHDGDPVLFINAEYKLSEEPVDPEVTFATRSELDRKLIALGELRFPHLRHQFHEAQKVRGFR